MDGPGPLVSTLYLAQSFWGVYYTADLYAAGENRYSEDSGASWLDSATAGYGGDFAFEIYGY